MFSSLLRWAILALVSLRLTILNEKQSEKVFTKQKPGDSSLLRLSNAGKT